MCFSSLIFHYWDYIPQRRSVANLDKASRLRANQACLRYRLCSFVSFGLRTSIQDRATLGPGSSMMIVTAWLHHGSPHAGKNYMRSAIFLCKSVFEFAWRTVVSCAVTTRFFKECPCSLLPYGTPTPPKFPPAIELLESKQ